MEFINPWFLLALVAVAIPVIIHLFNFRKFQRVYFTNVKFIEELQQQTQRHSQLKHLLVLLSRILAIIALVMAFAQPYIPVSKNELKKEARNAISIYLDNSFSMEAASSEGTLFEEGRKKAREIASVYKNSDLFQIITNDFEGRHQRYVSREEFLELLDEVDVSPVTRRHSEISKRQADLAHENNLNSSTLYIISDFQKGISDYQTIAADSTTMVYAIPIEASEKNNLFIDSIWFDSPVHRVNQMVNLNVRIKNSSENSFERIPVKLIINNEQRAIASFNVAGSEAVELNLPFTENEAGIQSGKLEISDYPVTYDDTYYFSYEVKPQIPVLAIHAGDESTYLNALFLNDSAFSFVNVSGNRLDYTFFSQNSLIVLNGLPEISTGLAQELKRFINGGGSILVFPGAEITVSNYSQFLSQLNSSVYDTPDTVDSKIAKINAQSVVFEDVFESIPENIDLPSVFEHYIIRRQVNSLMETLLELQNGDIFLSAEPVGNGMLYLCAVPLDPQWSDFPKHAIFVPALYRIALLSNPDTRLSYTTGENENIVIRRTIPSGDQIFKIISLEKDFEIIPEHNTVSSHINIFPRNQITRAGNFFIDYDNQQIAGVSFNYNRLESDLEYLSKSNLDKMFKDLGLNTFSVISPTSRSLSDVISEIHEGFQLWKIFVFLALIFLLCEVILLRFMKT